MISNIYAIKDELTGKFYQPFFINATGTEDKEALRLFAHNINSIPLWKDNASDYSLYKLGSLNDVDGILVRGYVDENGNYRESIEKMASGTSVRKE